MFTKIDLLFSSFHSIFDIVHLHLEWPQFKLYFDKLWFECVTATLLVLFYTHSLAVDFNVADTEIKANRSKVKRFINPRRAKYVRLGWAQYSPSRELLTTAGTNIIASFLRCLPVGPSATRSSRMVSVGGRSQVSDDDDNICGSYHFDITLSLSPRSPASSAPSSSSASGSA